MFGKIKKLRKYKKEPLFTVQDLFHQVLTNNSTGFSNLLFNLYQDVDCYTAEAILDDDCLIIGRDIPALVCDKEKSWETVLQEFKIELIDFYEKNKGELKNLSEISYGFVDGDVYYIKKTEKPKLKLQKKYTIEDFETFNDTKLLMWMAVYTDKDKREQQGIDTVVRELTDIESVQYRKYLAENFDYEKQARFM